MGWAVCPSSAWPSRRKRISVSESPPVSSAGEPSRMISPFAITAYRVNSDFGGDDALARVPDRLTR